MNKSETIKQKIDGIMGIEEDIGYSGETNGHIHVYQLSSNVDGTGTTIGTKTVTLDGQEVNAVNDHVHKIFDFQFSLANDGHSHRLT